MKPITYTRGQALPAILEQRIAILDGAMGTMTQRFMLTEDDYRGNTPAAPPGVRGRFKDHAKDLKNNGDVLSLTRPDVIRDIHEGYLAAGADIIETNTFGATRIAQEDYDLADFAFEMNLASARIARAAADKFSSADKPRFVAGALGPTPRTASISPDVNDPGARNVDFEQLRAAYYEQAQALTEGGADLLLVETIFDTLNAKAALFAIDEYFEKSGERLPLIISGTVTDASGRILSGQTVTAFWYSVRHAPPAGRGAELRARRRADAPLRAGAPSRRARHVHQLLPERRPAQPDERNRLRRDAGGHRAAASRIRGRGAGEHRRRLLRHDARTHRGDPRCGRTVCRAFPARHVLLRRSGLKRSAVSPGPRVPGRTVRPSKPPSGR